MSLAQSRLRLRCDYIPRCLLDFCWGKSTGLPTAPFPVAQADRLVAKRPLVFSDDSAECDEASGYSPPMPIPVMMPGHSRASQTCAGLLHDASPFCGGGGHICCRVSLVVVGCCKFGNYIALEEATAGKSVKLRHLM